MGAKGSGRPINEATYNRIVRMLDKKTATIAELRAATKVHKRTVYRYLHMIQDRENACVVRTLEGDRMFLIKLRHKR